MALSGVRSILLVDDDAALRNTLRAALAPLVDEVRACGSVEEAGAALADWLPDLALVDVVLPDGTGRDVLAALADREPQPLVVAMSGAAAPAQAFDLAQWGVHAWLDKPFTLAELDAAVERARREPPDLHPHLRDMVGRRPLTDVEAEVRDTMVREALARARHSRRGAARLLGVSRQFLQHILRRDRD